MSDTEIRTYAPGRVNLIGEHTDYNLGYALPMALQLGTTVTFHPQSSDDPVTITATSDTEAGTVTVSSTTKPGDTSDWGAYLAGCVWALRRSGYDFPGGRMEISSTVPVGSGLSSSAALECAVLLALTAGHGLSRHELAELAQRTENDYVGVPSGLLDQLASLHGQSDEAMLIDFRSLDVDMVPMPLEETDRLLVIDSHAAHRHTSGEYAARRESCAAAARRLGVTSLREADENDCSTLTDDTERSRARHVITENSRVLAAANALRASDLVRLGALMNASHESMARDFDITTPNIDLIVSTAQELGAYGARMTGGGFGGSVIAVSSDDVARQITRRLPDVVSDAGYPTPSVWDMRPGTGAHVL